MGMEKAFKKISALIQGGSDPNDAVDEYASESEKEEKRKKKRYLNKSDTEQFIESFRGDRD